MFKKNFNPFPDFPEEDIIKAREKYKNLQTPEEYKYLIGKNVIIIDNFGIRHFGLLKQCENFKDNLIWFLLLNFNGIYHGFTKKEIKSIRIDKGDMVNERKRTARKFT
jgi:hypothetical protein